MMGRNNSVKYYLPRFMTVRGYARPTRLTKDVEERSIKGRAKKRRRKVPNARSEEEVAADLKLIKDGEIMDMLADLRHYETKPWYDVGKTFFDVSQGSD